MCKLKLCKKCYKMKSIKAFSLNKSKLDGLASECKECHKIMRKNYYENNKEKEKKRIKERKVEISNWYKIYKKTLRCSNCNENESCCLEFHHNNPKKKDLSISQAAHQGWSIKRLEEEIAKCTVFCSNCHKKKHASLI